ncbi:MAG: hypothetical protein AAGM84_13110 [Pseudomonadota bacterium]
MNETWLQTSESEDVAGSLRHALLCFEKSKEDPHAWKWFVLAVHSALQGACVCHLVTTAPPLGAVTDTNQKEWVKYYNKREPDGELPKTRLLNLRELLKKVRKPGSCGGNSNGKSVSLSDAELTRLSGFHSHVRSQFVHFEPQGWSVEMSGIVETANLAARVIDDVRKIGWAFRHLPQDQMQKMVEDLRELSSLALER